jgi:hypothetical protein
MENLLIISVAEEISGQTGAKLDFLEVSAPGRKQTFDPHLQTTPLPFPLPSS